MVRSPPLKRLFLSRLFRRHNCAMQFWKCETTGWYQPPHKVTPAEEHIGQFSWNACSFSHRQTDRPIDKIWKDAKRKPPKQIDAYNPFFFNSAGTQAQISSSNSYGFDAAAQWLRKIQLLLVQHTHVHFHKPNARKLKWRFTHFGGIIFVHCIKNLFQISRRATANSFYGQPTGATISNK